MVIDKELNVPIRSILNIEKLQNLMDKFYLATKIPIGIISVDHDILVACGWQDLCTKFHRTHPETNRRCRESDDYIKNHLSERKAVQYKCLNGLWDIAIPLYVEDIHMANIFVGQFLYEDEEFDKDFFIKQAETMGFNQDDYMSALDKIRIFSRDEIKHIISYYEDFAQFISELALNNYKLQKKIQKLEGLLPICAHCKDIKDENGDWSRIEVYIQNKSEASFSHGLCPKCAEEIYGDKSWFKKEGNTQ